MADHAPARCYRTGPRVSWAVVPGGVLVVCGATARDYLLPYPEAAIWDMLGRGRSVEHVARLLPRICGVSRRAAARIIDHGLRRWVELGLLQPSPGDEVTDG